MKHNKSGNSNLSILNITDEELELHWKKLHSKSVVQQRGIIENSPCWNTNAADGRYSHQQKKICFAYQLSAWKKYGRQALFSIPSNKTSPDALVISHLCGNGPRCCNPDHLILESKKINDERTHCHFCLQQIYKLGDYRSIKIALDIGICSHEPACCTLKPY